jgi:hypothetical protein
MATYHSLHSHEYKISLRVCLGSLLVNEWDNSSPTFRVIFKFCQVPFVGHCSCQGLVNKEQIKCENVLLIESTHLIGYNPDSN